MLRVVLVDDELRARRGMRRLLARHPEVEVVAEADTLVSAVDAILRHAPDAVFLDIGLPDAEGFELVRRLPTVPQIVVVTAHAEHAIRAFDAAAVHYILKPVSAGRLAEAVERLGRAHAPAPERTEPDPVIRLRAGHRTVVTSPKRIVAVSAEGDFSRIMVESQRELLVLQPIKHLERVLPSPPFVRLSRSLIVNSRRLSQIEYLSRDRSMISLSGCTRRLTLGRVATARLRAWESRPAAC